MKFLVSRAAAALFLDPGLGKTSISLGAFSALKRLGKVRSALVIAPFRVCYLVWPAERKKWADFNGLKMVFLHGPDKDELAKQKADVYVINPEGIDWLFDVKKTLYTTRSGKEKTKYTVDTKRVKGMKVDLVIIDELSKFKSTKTGRFAVMKQVVDTFKYRWGLTGSPAANGLMGLFGQCYTLDSGKTLGRFITNFRRTYFDKDYTGFSYTVKAGAEEAIYKKIAPLALRLDAEDYIKLPALIHNQIEVALPYEAMKHYSELFNELITVINDEKISARQKADMFNKCRQVASGAVYVPQEVKALEKLPDAKRKWVNVHDEKLQALEQLIEELQGSPLLVAYEFHHDLEKILKYFGKDLPVIGSGTTKKETTEIEKAWNNGDIPVLLGQSTSASLGLNLQRNANHVCWYTLTWDYEVYDQLVRRVWRRGNTHSKVFVHYILGQDTIDEYVYSVLSMKKCTQDDFFKGLKKLQKRS